MIVSFYLGYEDPWNPLFPRGRSIGDHFPLRRFSPLPCQTCVILSGLIAKETRGGNTRKGALVREYRHDGVAFLEPAVSAAPAVPVALLASFGLVVCARCLEAAGPRSLQGGAVLRLDFRLAAVFNAGDLAPAPPT